MQRWAPALLVLIISVAAIGCPPDPNANVFPQYYNEARQILDAHSTLGQKYRSFNAGPDSDNAAEAMKFVKDTATPGLSKLAANAARMSFPEAPDIGALNQRLVDALTQKYEGYRKMVDGWENGDLEKFSDGRLEAVKATQDLIKYEKDLELWRRNGGRPPTVYPQ